MQCLSRYYIKPSLTNRVQIWRGASDVYQPPHRHHFSLVQLTVALPLGVWHVPDTVTGPCDVMSSTHEWRDQLV